MEKITIIIKCKADLNVFETIRSIDYPSDIIVALVKDPVLRARIESCGARVIDAPDNNVGVSCQLGLEAARHEFCLITDSDTTFGPGYIEACAIALKEADLCRGSIRFLTDIAVDSSCAVSNLRHYFNNICRPPYMPGLALRRSFALEIGGFDLNIRWGVDHEFGQRAITAGGRFHFLNSVWIEHLPITVIHDLHAAFRTGQAMRRIDGKLGVRHWRGWRLTSHIYEPYLDILRKVDISACMHHFSWVRSFQAGYWAPDSDSA